MLKKSKPAYINTVIALDADLILYRALKFNLDSCFDVNNHNENIEVASYKSPLAKNYLTIDLKKHSNLRIYDNLYLKIHQNLLQPMEPYILEEEEQL